MSDTATGKERAKEVRDKIFGEAKEQKQQGVTAPMAPARVEHHDEVAVAVSHSIGVSGFDELPTSIIPLGYYRLVQLNSKGVMLGDDTRAEAGSFYTDIGEEVKSIRVAILRTKMGKHTVKKNGQDVEEAIIKVLAIDTKTLTPFLMNITKGGFSAVGRLMMEFKKKGITSSYHFPVVIASEFVQTKDYEYYVPSFSIEPNKFDEEEMGIMAAAFVEYAGVLDKANFDEEEETVKVEVNPNRGKPGYDSAGRKVTDIPGIEEYAGNIPTPDDLPF